MGTVLSASQIESCARFLAGGGKTDAELARGLLAAKAADGAVARAVALADVFLTKSGEPRAEGRFITKKLREAEPGLTDAMVDAKAEYARLADLKRRLDRGCHGCAADNRRARDGPLYEGEIAAGRARL